MHFDIAKTVITTTHVLYHLLYTKVQCYFIAYAEAKAPITAFKFSKILLGALYQLSRLAGQNYKTDQERASTVTELNQLQGLRDGLQPREDVELCDQLVSPYVPCASLLSQ